MISYDELRCELLTTTAEKKTRIYKYHVIATLSLNVGLEPHNVLK